MDKFKRLIEVKKLIALLLTLTFVYLAIIGKVSSEQFITIFSVIIAFYFGQSTSRQAAREAKDNSIE